MNDLEIKSAFDLALKETLARRRIPRVTYRLQFNPDFTFQQAEALVSYLHDLGISDCYASPLLAACPGSNHGYDICDYSRLNPALGEEQDFEAFVTALQQKGLGLIFDMVPNHMGISMPGNDWWMDVLENGPSSQYAAYFDIDWYPTKAELENKVLLPILEDQYGQVLENGKLKLSFEEGSFFVSYYDFKLPVAPRSYSIVLTKCMENLTEALDEEDEDLQEFQSILTALEHLPPVTTQEPQALAERSREKEVIKRRLAALTGSNVKVRAAVEAAVAALQGTVGDPDSFDELHALLDAQAYRLAFWRIAAEEINYRRFFDINNLAAIRVELPEVFAATHALVFKLLAEGKITGLRIDHPDGLWSPGGYFRQLQVNYLVRQLQPRFETAGVEISEDRLQQLAASWLETVEQCRRSEGDSGKAGDLPLVWPLYIVAEKILSEGEPLPLDWAIYGTTGYDFLNQVNGIFINSANRRAFNRIYQRFSNITTEFATLANQTKEMIMRVALASEVTILAHQLEKINEKNRRYRDFTLNSVTVAIREVLACLPIYRTYITPPFPVLERDQHFIEAAIVEAGRRNSSLPTSLLRFLRDTLLLRNLEDFEPEDRPSIIDFVMKFQQVSGPLTAKGLEDTAFYIYNRLVSLNEVGGHPERFGLPVTEFHQKNLERSSCWPHSMLTTSTHDTKRSEDVRARLNVLSEMPEAWQKALSRWSRLNATHRTLIDEDQAPGRNDEYLFYQTVVGAWPFDPGNDRDEAASSGIGQPKLSRLLQPGSQGFADFRARILAYMQKATNEAKVHTSWVNPNEAYNAAIDRFVNRALDPKQAIRFLGDVLAFTDRLAYYGQFNSLAQLLLKLTSPGVPDIYQGTELWDFSLVDPDNRRLVNYDHRRALLADLKQRVELVGPEHLQVLAQELLETGYDGRIKLYVVERTLSFRRHRPDLFSYGDYQPLDATGSRHDHICAFARRLGDQASLTVTPRLVVKLTAEIERPPVGEVWGDTWLSLPDEPVGREYTNLFTGQTFQVQQGDDGPGLPLASVLSYFPVALLSR